MQGSELTAQRRGCVWPTATSLIYGYRLNDKFVRGVINTAAALAINEIVVYLSPRLVAATEVMYSYRRLSKRHSLYILACVYWLIQYALRSRPDGPTAAGVKKCRQEVANFRHRRLWVF